jgi:N4-gp56 family major capsid protein
MPFDGITRATPELSDLLVDLIRKSIIQSLRAGLPWLPKGVASFDTYRTGGNDQWVYASYPDLAVPAIADFTGTVYDLAEGVTPTKVDTFGSHNISVSAKEVARLIRVSQPTLRSNPHNFASLAADRVARAAAVMTDVAAESVWKAATLPVLNAYASTGGAAADTNPLDPEVVLDAVSYLRANDVAPIGDGSYVLIGHPYSLADLFRSIGERGWTDTAKMIDPQSLKDGVVGKWMGVTFVSSSRARKDGTVFPAFMSGAESIAFADPAATKVTAVLPTATDSDPLAQRASFGFVSLLGGAMISSISEQDGTTEVYRAVRINSTPKFVGTQTTTP